MVRSKWVLVAVVLAVLAGAGAIWWIMTAPERMVRQRVLDVLIDPSSAEFKDVKYFSSKDVGCGFVNSKNRMGGMVGFKTFIAFPDGRVRFDADPGDPDYGSWIDLLIENCAEKQ